jgi:nucleotide-binding universal stress UspA family protein
VRPIVVIPAEATFRVRNLVASAGWEIRSEGAPGVGGIDGALGAAGEGHPVLFLPPGSRVSRRLRRILVPHEGSPRVAWGLRAADEAARATGAGITVLHVPVPDPPTEAGSFPAPRVADHGEYGWGEWRAEFLRRFCRSSEGVSVDLLVATGPPVKSILAVAHRLRVDLLIMGWRGDADPGRALILRAVAEEAICPVLILFAGAGLTKGQSERAES